MPTARHFEIAARIREILAKKSKPDPQHGRTENIDDSSSVDASKKGMPDDPGFDTPSTITGKGGAHSV